MALSTQQIAGLNALNQKIAGGYTPSDIDKQNLAYATKQGYSYNQLPTGATKITDPNYLKTAGLTESQIYRSGSDIYKLPSLPQEIASDKMAGTTIPVAQPAPSVEPLMEGIKTGNEGLEAILKAQQTQLASQPKASALTAELEKTRGEQATAQRDLQEQTFQRFGLDQNVQQVQNIMPQIAKLQAEFDAASMAQEGARGTAGAVLGRQALIQRQKAVELAGLSAVAQAYQGNVDMARNIAQDAVNAQYQDITTYNNNLINQLDAVYKDLDKEEKVRANQLIEVINERKRNIETEKNNATAIQNLAIQSAQAGVDNTVVSNILKSDSISKAIEMASKAGVFLPEVGDRYKKIGTDANGNDIFADTLTNTVKTADQLTQNQLGNQVGTIKGLPSYDTRSANPGMVRSDRNNNPGNIKVTDYTKGFEGVIGVESNPAEDGGNFLIFENPQAGLDAIGRLLLEGKSYQGVNAETAIKRYNGNGAYGALNVGLDPNADFQSQIQDPNKRREVARAMAMAEGWSGGVTIPEAVVDALALTPNKKDELNDIIAKEKAQSALNLIDHNGLNNAVGTIALGRKAPFQWGQKADFIASVEQLISGLSLDSLIEAKSRGATFGALSDAELRILSNTASKIAGYRQFDKDGNVTGYKAREDDFKAELRNISNTILRASKVNVENQLNQTMTSTPMLSDDEAYNLYLQQIK